MLIPLGEEWISNLSTKEIIVLEDEGTYDVVSVETGTVE